MRGSLDVLLSTPMSTRSILAGKWWGTFRQIGPVLFWPAVLPSFWLLLDTGNVARLLLLIGIDPGLRRLITSLGLALATWVSRLGRAVALCVTAYVVVLDRLGDPDRRAVRAESPGAQPDDGDPGRRDLRRRFSDRVAGIHLLAR